MRSGDSCGESERLSFCESRPLEAEAEHAEHDRIHAETLRESRPEQDGDEEPEQTNSGINDLHARRAEERGVRCWSDAGQTSGPRAAP